MCEGEMRNKKDLMKDLAWAALYAIAATYVIAHLPFENVDSIYQLF